MKKLLIAVDDTKGAKAAFAMSSNICSCLQPETTVLVYVEKFEGWSLIDEMLGVAEMSELRESLKGTEFQAALDKKANAILDHYKKELEAKGITTGVKTVIKSGHPAEEILNTAKEEGVDMIVIGSRGKRVSNFLMGSVSREVANKSEIPVLLVK